MLPSRLCGPFFTGCAAASGFGFGSVLARTFFFCSSAPGFWGAGSPRLLRLQPADSAKIIINANQPDELRMMIPRS
jgi:hypothetical protein